MSTHIPLKEIYIGNIDGEEESSRTNFEQLFYTKNSKFNDIMRPEKFIITGRKGTGKTILANYIVKKINENKKSYSRVLRKNDFKLQKLIDLEYRELKEDDRSLFWKWFFLLQFGKVLVEERKTQIKLPFTPERKLNKFIKTKYPEDIFKLIDFNKSSTTKSKVRGKTSTIDSSIEESYGNNKNYGHKQFYELLSQLKQLVFQCLKKNNEITLIYDDLDEIEERVNESPNYYKLLISMLETIKELNLDFKKFNKKSTKIIVLLRSDIVEEIHKYSSNSNKLTTEGEVKLYWLSKNANPPASHPLIEMILYKVQKSVPNYQNLDNNSLYKILFPKKLHGKEAVDYLLNFSFGRPRDIIHYLNLIIKNNPEATFFEPQYFYNCSQEYSSWFFNELLNEISIHENKEALHDCLTLIMDMKKFNFNLDSIQSLYINNQIQYPNISNLKNTLGQLYKLGVIGNSWEHTRNKKGKKIYHFSWGHREDSRKDLNLSQDFVVHYGFRKHFT
ncbi:P-loop ATPase, Sll1717 family [Planomicrobium okeanokoites]|uniref:P-loop ATPase, Sll1717 family n=1 Tax=Planomicrobium okeanokoites TaxID=244 RepID=UPI0030F8FAAE